MAEITASMVKTLRDATNVSMMECKRALQEAEGDIDKATILLRERGIAIAAKKATREANEGLIGSASGDSGTTAALVEVNCETDFVARNEAFSTFVNGLAARALETDDSIRDTVEAEVTEKVTELGENIVVRRNMRFERSGPGKVESYVHLGGKIGVLVEIGCGKDETVQADDFQELARDLALHVAAATPSAMTPEELPEAVVAEERNIFAKQVEDKPADVVEKIVEGKMRKFYEQECLLHQGFIKEPKQSITDLLEERGKALGDELTIRRFAQYQLGN